MNNIIIGVDVGSTKSGLCVVIDYRIKEGVVIPNNQVIGYIGKFTENNNVLIVLEDIVSYDGKVNRDVLNTVKFIGELTYRISNELRVKYETIERWEVKKWAFDNYSSICIPEIEKNIVRLSNHAIRFNQLHKDDKKTIKRKTYLTADGSYFKPSFAYVGDRILVKVLKEHWAIEEQKKFTKNKYGLESHSWQGLSTLTAYIELRGNRLDIK